MREEFKNIYSLRPWLRYITWAGLLCTNLFLLWSSGESLFLCLHTVMQIPHEWRSHGSAYLLSLVTPVIALLFWLIICYPFIRGCHELALYHACMIQCQQQQANRHWYPAPIQLFHVSLAVSTPGGHAAMEDNTPTITLPRLRLPQKEPQILPVTQPRHTIELSPAQQSILQETPTRPSASSPTTITNRFSLRPLLVGIGWHSGITRSHNPNEDSLAVVQSTCTYHGQLVPFSLYVVADGMGGHDCGLEASHLAMQSMMNTVLQTIVIGNELSEEFLTDMLVGGVQWANLAVYERAQEWGKDMGTTLTAALVVGAKAYVVNVGDSRTYLYRNSAAQHLTPITQDHSLVARLVELGEITSDEIYTHPERNKVYRCLGSSEEAEVDWFIVDLHTHDQLILCSDGLWEMVRDFEIERILNYDIDPSRTCDMLVQAALRGGGRDNVSIIVAKVP